MHTKGISSACSQECGAHEVGHRCNHTSANSGAHDQRNGAATQGSHEKFWGGREGTKENQPQEP